MHKADSRCQSRTERPQHDGSGELSQSYQAPERAPDGRCATGDYSVGIIHFKDSRAVNRLIQSMSEWTLQPREIFVADNSRDFGLDPDNAARWLGKVSVLDMGDNLGYGAAANRVISEVGGRTSLLLLLTQDAVLMSDAAELLQNAVLRDERLGVAVPVLTFSSDPTRIFSAGGTLGRSGRTLHSQQGQPLQSLQLTPSSERAVDWGDGACLMIRLSAARQVEGFDPNFFLYVEEVDFQYRLRRSGFGVVIVADARASQEPGYYSLYYKYRNLTYFTRKHKDGFQPWPWWIALVKDSLKAIWRGAWREIPWAIRGLLDSGFGTMGPRPSSVMQRESL